MSDYLPMIVSGIANGSVVAIAAMGLVLSYKASGIFNFAHGAIGAVAAGVFYQLYALNGWPAWLSVIVTLIAVGGLVGLLMERVAHLISAASSTMKIVATIGIMLSLSSLFNLRYGGITQVFPKFLPRETFRLAGVNIAYSQVILVMLGLSVAVGMTIFFRRTRMGRAMRAIVDDPELVSLVGFDPDQVRRWAWIIGVSFAAMAGVFIAPNIGLDGTTLTLLVVEGFGAAAIGRFSSLPLTYVGAVVIQVGVAVATRLSVDFPALQSVPSALPFGVLFFVLLLSPKGWLVEVGEELQQRVTTIPDQSLKVGALKTLPMIVVVLAAPFVFDTHLIAWTRGLVFIILLLSLSLLVRLSNQVSLCQLTFAAVGAVSAYHLSGAGVPWVLAVLAGGVIAVPIGAIVAIPAVRLSGIYLALATLSFGLFVQTLIYDAPFMFGDSPLPLTTPRPGFASTSRAYYYVLPVVIGLCYLVVRQVERGRLGQLLRCKADSPVALEALGVPIRMLPYAAFCIAGFLAGIAGALLGPNVGVVGKGDFGMIPMSLLLVALLVMNGRERRVGSLGASFGAAMGLIVLPEYIGSYTWLQGLTLFFGVAAVEAALASTRPTRVRAEAVAEVTAVDPGPELVGTRSTPVA